MRKLTVAAFITLDGIMQGPGGPAEDTTGGFRHGGWVFPYADGAFGEAMSHLFARPFSLVLGRRTYDIFADHWPRVSDDHDDAAIAAVFNPAEKLVATHRPGSLAWENSHALGTDVVGALREAKRRDGPDLLTQGSGDLVHQLLAGDVVDELRLLTFPVLLGEGKRLFDDRAHAAAFRLQSSVASSTGVVISHYVRDGAVQTGSFELP